MTTKKPAARYERREIDTYSEPIVDLVCRRCNEVVGRWYRRGPWAVLVAEREETHDREMHGGR